MIHCYIPAQWHKKDQLDFISFLRSHIVNFDTEKNIMWRYFNFYINRDLDKQKNMNSSDTNPIYR